MESTTCSVPGCDGKPVGRDLCKPHYERLRRTGGIPPRPKKAASCAVDDCAGMVVARDYCDMHYRRWLHHGSATHTRPTPEERFWSYVDKGPDNKCWPWTGGGWPSGYGALRIGGEKVGAHRFSYELHIGPIPEDFVVDHLCRNPGCVNPAHLEAVTFRENILRGNGMAARYARRKTCIRGHSYDAPNGYITSQGGRGCRKCNDFRRARNDAKRQAAAAAGRRPG